MKPHSRAPTWDQALDTLDTGPDAQPLRVSRFGTQLDAQGVLIGSRKAKRCIRYLTKYLTKSVAECHAPAGDPEQAHVDRFAAALQHEPGSPTCANWLLHGVQPRNAKPRQRPDACRARTHEREHLGYGGRRVLVSRKWSGKTLTDHRAERRAWVTDLLGRAHEAPDPHRYLWTLVRPGDPAIAPLAARLLRAVADFDTVAVEKRNTPQRRHLRDLEVEWQQYHQQHATLRVVSRAAYLSRPRF